VEICNEFVGVRGFDRTLYLIEYRFFELEIGLK